jgi:hypothetical protein
MDLIHMKGRVYDPTIGRFLQADLVVQAQGQILSYNRYAYVWNNPGAYTDPSGYYLVGEDGSRMDGEGNKYSTENQATEKGDIKTKEDDQYTGVVISPDAQKGQPFYKTVRELVHALGAYGVVFGKRELGSDGSPDAPPGEDPWGFGDAEYVHEQVFYTGVDGRGLKDTESLT